MRRRDFLKCVAAAVGVYYHSPFTPGHKVNMHEVIARIIVEHLREDEYRLLLGAIV